MVHSAKQLWCRHHLRCSRTHCSYRRMSPDLAHSFEHHPCSHRARRDACRADDRTAPVAVPVPVEAVLVEVVLVEAAVAALAAAIPCTLCMPRPHIHQTAVAGRDDPLRCLSSKPSDVAHPALAERGTRRSRTRRYPIESVSCAVMYRAAELTASCCGVSCLPSTHSRVPRTPAHGELGDGGGGGGGKGVGTHVSTIPNEG